MQRSELKNLVFTRFEERRLEIIKKRNRFQRELDQDLHHLREAYGTAAVNGLGELTLTVTTPETATSEKSQTPTEPPPRTRSRSKRKRQRRPAGSPTFRRLLAEHLPAAVAAVAKDKEEFRARDIHDYLKNVNKLDISYTYVSLYLVQNADKLGLTVEKRKGGEPIPRPTHFFRASLYARLKTAPKSQPAKSAGHVDWEVHITTALKGLRQGLTQLQLKDKLVKAGVPLVKFRGIAYLRALSRLIEQQLLKVKNDRYLL